jgi:hypothetical protein
MLPHYNLDLSSCQTSHAWKPEIAWWSTGGAMDLPEGPEEG